MNLVSKTGLVEPGGSLEFGLHVLDFMSAQPGALSVGLREEGEMKIAYAHWLNRQRDLDIARVEKRLMTTLFGRREIMKGGSQALN